MVSKISKNSRILKIGEVYDQLTVIDFITIEENKKKVKFAICKCSCGNQITKRTTLVKYNETNNCGCGPRVKWEGFGNLPLHLFNRYKRNAKRRNIIFHITIEYVWQLYLSQNKKKCALSNIDIIFGKKSTDVITASLDRINSNQGYIENNLQWVHKDVQKMKMDLLQEKFIELCKLISIIN